MFLPLTVKQVHTFIHRRYAAVSLMFFFPFLDPSSFLRQPISIDGTGTSTHCMAAFSYTIHRRVHGRNARCLLIEAMMLLPIMKDIFSTRRVEGGGRGKRCKVYPPNPFVALHHVYITPNQYPHLRIGTVNSTYRRQRRLTCTPPFPLPF